MVANRQSVINSFWQNNIISNFVCPLNDLDQQNTASDHRRNIQHWMHIANKYGFILYSSVSAVNYSCPRLQVIGKQSHAKLKDGKMLPEPTEFQYSSSFFLLKFSMFKIDIQFTTHIMCVKQEDHNRKLSIQLLNTVYTNDFHSNISHIYYSYNNWIKLFWDDEKIVNISICNLNIYLNNLTTPCWIDWLDRIENLVND